MKRTTSAKSKPKSQANPQPTPPPKDPKAAEIINGPTPEARPCSPADTQKGHHEVIQS